MNQNSKEEWLRWACNLIYLLENDYEWIYIDEFRVSDRSYKPYGWRFKGQNSLCSIMPEAFKFMFIVSLSSKAGYSVLGTTATENSILFSQFRKWVADESKKYSDQNNKVVNVWDNASIHKTQRVRDLLKTSKINMHTISPYSPWLNPVEGFIGSFKNKLWSEVINGK